MHSPFIQDEAAIKTCNPNKSPGPDGVTNAFYINHLNQVKPILTTLFNDILENPHHITTEFTEGLIHTIYKKGNPLLISNRRPITLLNTDYKILSKVINARLLRILPFIINNNQTGFVPHRFIIDNIININELINYLKSKNLPGIITLFDFFKAFDSISHDSIKRTLIHIGIPIKLINLIHKLLSDPQAKISINDEEIQINKLISWFMNSPANSESPTLNTNSFENNTSTIHSRAKIPLICYDRSLKPLKEGGWGMWNIQLRQVAQKIWIYNRFLQMHKSANNSIYMISWMDQIINKSISSPYLIKIKKEWENYATQIGHLKDKVQTLQPILIKNQTSQTLTTNNISLPPTLKEIYSTILNNHQCKSKDYIGKKYSDLLLTSHQQSIQLLWKYTYDQLFVKIQKLKDPKGRDTMQRFHARCLPINHLHNKVCPICNNEMNNDPYGHLFFNCQHTINFINHDKLKNFIYKNCNGNIKKFKKEWSINTNEPIPTITPPINY
ncbi:hypothetical protein DDB_G0268610 [Dictyostelium discoideum AX4]|uniref:Reverse transcriptase domain-containing protein n=1 Tax=Dictyostelium discoideum TaxID=44689 RepID=Q55F53_DICDI|nr:hypothetical protein DDB_G0268610 [Dictyostelium discoideum AX4]EAL73758.1 hypothetical protein DDB_G0268610 [Dictyostelium discoideum AX4]|eukprot:XP_647680.1 hypothetical protein DDB_G0268610 [Dictyostelium discoideum AX4]